MESDNYGEAFVKRCGGETASVLISRTLNSTTVAITETASSAPKFGLSEAHPYADAFLICAVIKEMPELCLWEDGRPVPPSRLRAGDTEIIDLKTRPVFLVNNAFHTLHFYFPRAAIDEIADNAGVPRIEGLRRKKDRNDRTIRNLARTLLPAMKAPAEANRLFVDQITMAIGSHSAVAYGGMRVSKLVPGGLAPWQERRALEMLDAQIDGNLSLTKLALSCDLSVSHFSRAFRRTTGLAPHQWLLQRRIELAKSLMLRSNDPLSEIALICGFADQSHFTRVFSGLVGLSPGAWRRAV